VSEAPVPVYCLDFHRDYACRSSGVCCTSGWPIAVERPVFQGLVAALEAGALRLDRARGDAADVDRLLPLGGPLPEDASARLGQDEGGVCLFLESEDGRRCSIHRQLGEPALPTACCQFPRIALLDDRGVFVSLSHYCPTAARMLLRDDARGDVVLDPPGWLTRLPLEGLDARGQPPPLLRPRVFFDWESLAVWERTCRLVLGREDLEPGDSLALLRGLAETARRWKHSAGSLRAHLETLEDEAASRVPVTCPIGWDDQVSLHARAVDTVPRQWRTPALAAPRSRGPRGPADLAGTRAIRRYLLARLHGSWCWYQGRGVLSTVASLETALAVLAVELARDGGEPLAGPDEIVEAIRRADLLLVHLARSEALAELWCERDDRDVRARASSMASG